MVMKAKKQKEAKAALIFLISSGVVIFALLGFLVFFLNSSSSQAKETRTALSVPDYSPFTETPEGKISVDVKAKNGFYPSELNLPAGKPTVLNVETDNTYDCSSTISFPALGLRKTLLPSDTASLELPSQESGTSLTATCSMGHYFLTINYN